ncbi:hypothetical protein [Natronolimnohabitans innermongolicus]|uniref:DUF8108 domain-containing protein n=1 Tax=Natronolimnohabitans innermongolicus JCM 12255 TaxID=1227499 RepID=L9XHV1_9EURY|nr:hypothetical protein [Natronolimnohabitans innermongolicus]ELY61182.1 hypothetical protein C493_02673 [Natronolimnohabitans innermongolicus JCM 12255]
MERPDDVVFRLHVELFALLRRVLPIAILAGALVGPLGTVGDPSIAMWYSAALFAACLFVLWALNGLPLYPAHTFGIEYRFEDEPLESERRPCIRCDTVTSDGVHRRYARQVVALGVPVYTLAWGSNDFCRDCLGTPHASRDERAAARTRETSTTERPTDTSGGGGGNGGSATADGPGRDGGSPSPPVDEDPGTTIARRVTLEDETTALEVRRAFADDDR